MHDKGFDASTVGTPQFGWRLLYWQLPTNCPCHYLMLDLLVAIHFRKGPFAAYDEVPYSLPVNET
jgi:hypothetical protein